MGTGGNRLFAPVILSLKVAITATFISLIIGTILSYFLANYDFFGKSVLETLLTLPLVLPPTVLGYVLLTFFGRRRFLGEFLAEQFGIQVVFTPLAAVLAATIVSLPLVIQSIKSTFSSIDPIYKKAASTLGTGRLKIFFTITLPMAWPGIVSGIVMGFARSLGEFGATLMIAGNIPGLTQTIPTAIYSAVETGDLERANQLVMMMTIFSFLLIWFLNGWLKKKHYLGRRQNDNASS